MESDGRDASGTRLPVISADSVCQTHAHSGSQLTCAASATESESREAASHICSATWCAAIGVVPCLAAMEVARVMQARRARVRARRRPPDSEGNDRSMKQINDNRNGKR